jgi:hypothetical protein
MFAGIGRDSSGKVAIANQTTFLYKRTAVEKLVWQSIYRETELYKSAVRIYTKPLFQWRKALATSSDGGSLYDFAAHGLRELDRLHWQLSQQRFSFRPAVPLRCDFHGKARTLYVYPWEERIVDLMLFRAINRRFHSLFSPRSFAYRDRQYSLDACQHGIASVLRRGSGQAYVIKRDIADYFPSIDHHTLLEALSRVVDSGDYLFRLLRERIEFTYLGSGMVTTADRGIPFGSAISCWFANLLLTDMDHDLAAIPEIHYFRYADDLLVLSRDSAAADHAAHEIDEWLYRLHLRSKTSHEITTALIKPSDHFRHLGLQFYADGSVRLGREKCRKITNLFRFALRRKARRLHRVADPRQKAQRCCDAARAVVDEGVRNVAIIDYYLKHVDDESQLENIDRWLAEEVLSRVFGGHRKGHFNKISFAELRAMGLPSLVHRRRLLLQGKLEGTFLRWQRGKREQALKGTVARLRRKDAAFSSIPEAVASSRP